MKLTLFDTIICRTPAFNLQAVLQENIDALAQMISEASPSFHQTLAAGLPKQGTKAEYTLWKYFSRAKYRATPFGTFAAVTVASFSHKDTSLVIGKEIIAHRFCDWKGREEYTARVTKTVAQSKEFLTNSTHYTVGKETRYIRFRDSRFEMAAVINFPELTFLLEICKNQGTKKDIYKRLSSTFKLDQKSIDRLLCLLVSAQLLTTDRYPNITGEDYFKRISARKPALASKYIIAERSVVAGGLSKKPLTHLSELLNFLYESLPDSQNIDLTNFRNTFVKKFEHQQVPLTVALDPEIGIGYGNLEQAGAGDELINALNASHQVTENKLLIYHGLQEFLLNAMLKGGEILLDKYKITPKPAKHSLPNTFNVVYHMYNGRTVIESAGGCTATALLGRFTQASPDIERYCKTLVEYEKKANPGILFFDVAYQAEKHVDNVNRRHSFYEAELPLLSWPGMRNALHMEDILVSVNEKEIILNYKPDGRRMIPRIPSAYNYTRSDLSVFRFLCDLQAQGLKAGLSFRLQDHFPNLNHYPRVSYKNLILSPAMWRVPDSFETTLSDWLEKEKINFLFKVGSGDSFLCFDPSAQKDLLAFQFYCSQATTSVYITEALIDHQSDVRDENDHMYAAQFIVSVGYDRPIYAIENKKKAVTPSPISTVLPGGEWLYFELFCHQERSSRLLLGPIASFIKKNNDLIKKWFFIRYNEQGHHIRLRLQIKDPTLGYALISRLKTFMDDDIRTGALKEIAIKTYFRETARYGAARMGQVEQFFCLDSQYALYLLKRSQHTTQIYATTLVAMERLVTVCFEDMETRLTFARRMADRFAVELSMTGDHFKLVNQHFNQLRADFESNVMPVVLRLLTRHEQLLRLLLKKCMDEEKPGLLADLIHMHINRLFNTSQRTHEAILYHYLVRLLLSRRAISSGLLAR